MLQGTLKDKAMTNTTQPFKKPSGKPSPKLAQMLRNATPQQIEQATKIAAKLLKAKSKG